MSAKRERTFYIFGYVFSLLIAGYAGSTNAARNVAAYAATTGGQKVQQAEDVSALRLSYR